MGLLTRGGARLHYAVHGSGYPVLTLAPGGMRSAAQVWDRMPWHPVPELAGSHSVITMDQRNAGASTAPVTGTENWATYAADQLAVLDDLGVERAHVVGMCIGGAFILRLLQAAPHRFGKAVVLQPIGLDDNRQAFHDLFDAWAAELAPSHPEATPAAWSAYRDALYGGSEVLFSVPESTLGTIVHPMLVLAGDDQYHPRGASELLARRVPRAQLIEHWKSEEHLPAARSAIASFLAGA
jgi:pimeloyl-ACP methyl ester carboxylesterase